MNHTQNKQETVYEDEFSECSESSDGSFMSECIPEEDGEISGKCSDSCSGCSGNSDPLSEENAALLKRVEDLTSSYLTLAADFDNYKKRTVKQMEDVKKFAAEPLMKDMIEVADNFERAINSADSGSGDGGALAEGIKNTYRQFITLLESHGLSKIPSAPGTEFDPHLHESVSQIPTNDYPEETIVDVFKSGYTLHSKVIRPASVVVSTSADE
jgi:Molecular chaperone GrpE (heat shock protein)